jgi:hypothetical protein
MLHKLFYGIYDKGLIVDSLEQIVYTTEIIPIFEPNYKKPGYTS